MNSPPPLRFPRPLVLICVLLPSVLRAVPETDALTFDDRVAAQEAIERYYYSHQLGVGRPYEEVITRDVLERKVRAHLQEEAALDQFWRTPVTARMLQAESTRIRRATRFPERLAEVQRALRDDPALYQECFVRPVLAHRLARNFFAFDARIHGEARARAEALRLDLASREIDPLAPHCLRTVTEVAEDPTGGDRDGRLPDGRVSVAPEEFLRLRHLLPDAVGAPSTIEEDRDAFRIRALLDEGSDRLLVATYTLPKIRWEDWWKDASHSISPGDTLASVAADMPISPAAIETGGDAGCPDDDGWTPTPLDMPTPRERHTAVWTGTKMIVWGGADPARLNTGGVYDPLTDSWAQISTAGAPSARSFHSAVWTGERMIVWGGSSGPAVYYGDGGRYDPLTDSWTPMATEGAPASRDGHSTVWTGAEMIVWGGTRYGELPFGDGARYDPATDTWSAISMAGAPSAQVGHVAVWTGTEMIIWGGGAGPDVGGARYDPATDAWSTMTTAGAPARRFVTSAVWTGTEMVVWGGMNSTGTSYFSSGGRYNPIANAWTPTSLVGAPSPRAAHIAAWTGSRMLVWSGDNSLVGFGDGRRYNPATDNWTPIAALGAPPPRSHAAGVWTGDRLLVWGGSDFGDWPTQGGRYDPNGDTWTPMSSGTVPSPRTMHSAVWTGNEMIVWGGSSGTVYRGDGGRYDPLTDSWYFMSASGAPSARRSHSAAWTGERMLLWGGFDGAQYRADGAAYDPGADAWTPLETLGAPQGRSAHTSVWTGDRMIVWGGEHGGGGGGIYDPASNAWSTMSTANSPSGSLGHSAVWSGREMIVWGGSNYTYHTNTGGRYDPTTDEWSPTSTVGAPSVRSLHAATWTGSEMIVWGGWDGQGFPGTLGNGGHYDPGLDTWSAISEVGAPTPRRGHSAIWSGREMVVFGGYVGTGWTNAGGRYDPVLDSWRATPVAAAPVPRSEHSAVWTGAEMLIWGGTAYGTGEFMTGGAYILDQLVDNDGDGLNDCGGDCDDWNPESYPGALEICDGRDNDCDGALPPEEGVDSDADGSLVCIDCNDQDAGRFPGNPESCDGVDNDCDQVVDTFATNCGIGLCVAAGLCSNGVDSCIPGAPAPEICDRLDNDCNGGLPGSEIDDDGDGLEECFGDCDDGSPATHPGAPEANDGLDNQCPGDPGEGLVDEISGLIGFFSQSDSSELCWPAQQGATEYHISRALDPRGDGTGCGGAVVSGTCWHDPETPAAGRIQYYLVRSSMPYTGSWGVDSSLLERGSLCPFEPDCSDGEDDDLDGSTDCDDVTDCYGQGACLSRTFSFVDTFADNIATTSVLEFLAPLPASPSDYLWFALERPAVGNIEFCLGRADFYREHYLALAATQGIVESGGWEKFHRAAPGGWVGPITGSHENWFGGDCAGSYSWCPEVGLGGHIPAVAPGEASYCEAFENIECSDGSWRLTIRIGVDRLTTCGF